MADAEEEEQLMQAFGALNSSQKARRGAVFVKGVSPEEIEAAARGEGLVEVPKTEEQLAAIEKATASNVMFEFLEEDEMKQVIAAMEHKKASKGDAIIEQGDVGDYFYVLADGEVDIFVYKSDDPKCPEPPGQLVVSLGTGGAFGELALIYGKPRAATVKAKTDCELWAIDGESYRRTLMGATIRKRRQYEKFLSQVEILTVLDEYERMSLADALRPHAFEDAEVIINQGDKGDMFYLILEGECVVTQTTDAGTGEVGVLKEGDYFGELALIHQVPRAATVTAKGHVKTVCLDRDCFTRIMGECTELLKRKSSLYLKYGQAK